MAVRTKASEDTSVATEQQTQQQARGNDGSSKWDSGQVQRQTSFPNSFLLIALAVAGLLLGNSYYQDSNQNTQQLTQCRTELSTTLTTIDRLRGFSR